MIIEYDASIIFGSWDDIFFPFFFLFFLVALWRHLLAIRPLYFLPSKFPSIIYCLSPKQNKNQIRGRIISSANCELVPVDGDPVSGPYSTPFTDPLNVRHFVSNPSCLNHRSRVVDFGILSRFFQCHWHYNNDPCGCKWTRKTQPDGRSSGSGSSRDSFHKILWCLLPSRDLGFLRDIAS